MPHDTHAAGTAHTLPDPLAPAAPLAPPPPPQDARPLSRAPIDRFASMLRLTLPG